MAPLTLFAEATDSTIPQAHQTLDDDVAGLALQQEGNNDELEESDVEETGNVDWRCPTWLEEQYSVDKTELAEAVSYFGQSRSEAELDKFLGKVPSYAGWIHRTLPALRKAKGTTAILFMGLCPKREEVFGVGNETPDIRAFTVSLLSPMANILQQATGKHVVALNVRKQCRRTPNLQNCAQFSQAEFDILSAATRVELLIAKHVYNIDFSDTLAWSEDVAGTGKTLDSLLEFSPCLLGHVYRVPFHPRHLAFVGTNAIVAQVAFRCALQELILPILSDISG